MPRRSPYVLGDNGWSKPIIGIVDCCARAASGHAAAALPSSVMNSRRLIDLTPRPRIRNSIAGMGGVQGGASQQNRPPDFRINTGREQMQQHECAEARITRSPRRHGQAALVHGEAKRIGGFEVDDQLIFSRCLHRKISRLFALEDAIDVGCRP